MPRVSHSSLSCLELALCGCGRPRCHSTPSYGPSGLPLPQRDIGSRNCREGSGRCSSRQARPPGRRPGDLGPAATGSDSCLCRAQGLRPCRADPAPGREEGLRGAGRAGRTGGGAAAPAAPAQRAEEVPLRELRASGGGALGAVGERSPEPGAPVPPPPPPDPRSAREPAAPRRPPMEFT